MTRKPKPPPPNYDYTASARGAARRARAAAILAPITLDAQHAAALQWLVDDMDLPRAAIVRRLILDEAKRRGAPIE